MQKPYVRKLSETVSLREGPTCEVVIVHGNPLRLLFRSHHNVMDGRGTFVWMKDVLLNLTYFPEGIYSGVSLGHSAYL